MIATTTNTPYPYVEWSPIIAGTVLASATTLVLVQFGNAIGLSFDQLYYRENIAAPQIIMVGLWILWTQLMASMAGGYLAGRLRAPWVIASHESEIRDGAHGLLVWATSSVLVAIALAFSAFASALVAPHGVEPHHVELSHDTMRKLGIISSFALAASSIVSAVAAWVMAGLGGDHRDNAGDVSRYITFRKKVVVA